MLKLKQGEKKAIVERMITIPPKNKRPFWAREMKFLNELFSLYPNVDFWKLIKFNQKYDSLIFLKGDYGKKTLKKKFLEFSYEPKQYKPIKISKKTGKDFSYNKTNKTIKDFLKNE